MAATAAYFGARVVPHVCAGPISLAANLHVVATVPVIRAIEYPYTLAPSWAAFGRAAHRSAPTRSSTARSPSPTAPASASTSTKRPSPPIRTARPGLASPAPVGGLPDRFVGDR